MKEILGLSTDTLMIGVVVILAAIAVVLGIMAWRRPLLFKLGLRNVPRRRAQTALITLGLMISTLIIATAFTVGDTLSSSLRNTAFEITGPIDHLIQYDPVAGSAAAQRDAVVPQQVADDLVAEFGDDPDIVTFVRTVFDAVSAENLTTEQSEPRVFLVGLDGDEVDTLGGIPSLDGRTLSLNDLQAGTILLNESAAEKLAAAVGDTIALRVLGQVHTFTVAGLAEDTLLSGQVDPADPQGAVITLRDAQDIFDQPERLTGIGVSVRGGISGALKLSEDVDARLNGFLRSRTEAEASAGPPGAGQPAAERVYSDAQGNALFVSDPFKADTVDDAETFGSIFTSFFLIMGLFSIAAGTLLIFLIFAMLAKERKSEMGISRAVGMQRGQLVQSFLAEGMAYDLGAAVVGTVLGILIAFGMVEVLNAAFDEFGFTFTQHVEPRSVVIAAGLGIIITFVTVVISSFRVSQLNIVSAIRDLPDDGTARRRRVSALGVVTTPVGLVLLLITTPFTLVLGGLLLVVPGLGGAIRRRGWSAAVILPGWRLMRWRQEWWFVLLGIGVLGIQGGIGSDSAFLYLAGLSSLPIGLVLLARRLGRAGRAAYSLMGAAILVFWLSPQQWHADLTGSDLQGGPEMFVLSGVLMVTGATVLAVFNLDLLTAGFHAGARLTGRLAPVLQTAAAYPAASRYRTGLTVAMIAIIMFALVTFTTINANFSRAFTSDAARGGYDVQADTTRNDNVTDLRAALDTAGAQSTAQNLANVGRLRVGSSNGTNITVQDLEQWDSVRDRPVHDDAGSIIVEPASAHDELVGPHLAFLVGADAAFLDENDVPLQARAVGFDSDAAVWDALRNGGTAYAVVSADAVASGAGFGVDDDAFEMPNSVNESASRIPRVRVSVQNGGRSTDLTIIGVIDQVVGVTSPEFPVFPTLVTADTHFDQIYEDADLTRFLGRVQSGVAALDVARAIEADLRVETVSIKDELEDQQQTFNAILMLFQGFTGLGLLAGLAALGVIAMQAVVERRQQIGVLRAIGFRRQFVGLELLLEMGFIAVLGVGLGTILAVALAWRLFSEDIIGSTGGISFYVPVVQIAIFAAAALVAAMLMTYLPARQAARITIAEALRYE